MILTEAKSNELAGRIREAVEQALTDRNLSARRASMDVVGHDGLIRDIRAGRIPSADRIAALFEYLGLEAYFGPKREAARPEELRAIRNLDPDQDAPVGFLVIPWHGAGPGSGSAPVAFSRAWLESQNLKPDFLQAIMPDRFAFPDPPSAGSVALLDTRLAPRQGADLWCFRDSGRTTVARITFKGDMAAIHPARFDDETQLVNTPSAMSLGLIGRVVWLGQVVPVKGQVE